MSSNVMKIEGIEPTVIRSRMPYPAWLYNELVVIKGLEPLIYGLLLPYLLAISSNDTLNTSGILCWRTF